MASFTVEVRPGANGPIYIVTGAAGHTVTINDYAHPNAQQGAMIADQHGRPGKQITTST